MSLHRFEKVIAGRPYLIEVTPVAERQWRANIVRIPGVPTALMPFYGETPDEAVRRELLEEMNLSLPLSLWTVYDSRRGNGTVAFTNYLYQGKLNCPAEDIPLTEGQRLRYFSREEIDHIPVAFGFETQIKRFFEEYEST